MSLSDVLSISLGLFSIVLAFVLYFRQKTEVSLRYAIVNQYCLILPSDSRYPEKLQIKYDDRPIPALSKVTILFWNQGRKTLSSSDFASSDRLALHFAGKEGGVRVLEVRSTRATRQALKVETAVSEDLINVDFEFLGHTDGFALEVFYGEDPEVRVKCTGSIKGPPKETRRYQPDPLSGGYFYSPFFLIRAVGIILATALVSFISLALLVASFGNLAKDVWNVLLCALFFFVSTLFLVIFTYDFRQQAIPLRIRKLARDLEV